MVKKQTNKKIVCQYKRYRFNPWVGKIPWRRKWQATPVFLPGKFHGQKLPGGLQSMGVTKEESDTIY